MADGGEATRALTACALAMLVFVGCGGGGSSSQSGSSASPASSSGASSSSARSSSADRYTVAAGQEIDANGYRIRVPDGFKALRTFPFTMKPANPPSNPDDFVAISSGIDRTDKSTLNDAAAAFVQIELTKDAGEPGTIRSGPASARLGSSDAISYRLSFNGGKDTRLEYFADVTDAGTRGVFSITLYCPTALLSQYQAAFEAVLPTFVAP